MSTKQKAVKKRKASSNQSTPNKSSNENTPKRTKKKIAKAYPSKSNKTPSISIGYIFIAIIIRICSALFNPIADCDETFNYWEPTAFLLTNYGFQTWEYAPQYALRSYTYLLPQFGIGKLLSLSTLTSSPIIIFYTIRCILSLICLLCEIYFVRSLTRWFGKKTAFITFIFLSFSSGMFNVCSAYLPQQFVLNLILLSFGCLFRQKRKRAVFLMGVAVIFGWPFICLLAIPMALDCIAFMGIFVFLSWTALFGIFLCFVSVMIDYFYYSKLLLAPLNIFLYNLSIFKNDDETEELDGQNLYGIDDWTYYAKNLVFNWNIAYVLALIAPFASNIFVLMMWNKKKKSKNRGRAARVLGCWEKILNLFRIGGDSNSAIVGRLMHCMLPFWIWYLFFTQMPHKEERFMFVIYPFIALNAALTLTQFRMFKISENGKIFGLDLYKFGVVKVLLRNVNFLMISVFVTLCLSRTIGQVLYILTMHYADDES